MKSKISKRFLWVASLGLLLNGAPAIADDTEIFFNTPSSEIRTNILFFLDNSGSMSSTVTTLSTYDNSTVYTGSASSSNIYFLKSGNFYSIPKTSNKCNDILARLDASGAATAYQMARWSGSSRAWVKLSTANVSSNTECYLDRGVHGATDSSSSKYIRNNTTSQWGSVSQEASWGTVSLNDFYSANYVNWYNNHRVVESKTRLQIVQEAAKNLANSMSNVNIGLMTFNVNAIEEGGRVLVPVANVETNRTAFNTAVDGLTASTWTPLSEALFGAMRYFQGGAPFLDNNPVASTVSGGNYISPIESDCQKSAIVLLTDGEPTKDDNHEASMESSVGACTGDCLDEIASYLHGEDQCSLPGDQTVSVYTVGFETDQALLADTATNGGGSYYLADDAESLETVFNSIVRSVMQTSTTFVSPGIAVNTFNRLNHLDALYFSVFQPEQTPLWAGNLKRYRLASDGVIMDSVSQPAVEKNTGFFKSTAKSWWLEGETADGADVSKGGAAVLHPTVNAERKVFTHYPGSSSSVLSSSNNALTVANKANLTKTMFGNASMSDAEHDNLINWTRGADTGGADPTLSRKFIADPLHSIPQLVIYGGSSAAPDVAIFFGDNQGFLHAVNGETGEAYFSFMPSELFPIQATLMANNDIVADRPYGMDGSPTSWIEDYNGDGVINSSVVDKTTRNDFVRLYTGMRRGGRNYYGLDVTDRSNPVWLWTIRGGTGDFTELGQSWSKPTKTKINIQNAEKEVLIFGGGYDTQQDTVTVRTADTVGRAIYIVDAATGSVLWWAGPTGSGADVTFSDMKYSIPSSPKVIDVSGDGLADQIYVGDMGGQIWRLDIANGESARNLVTGGVIGDFGGSDASSHRRFYYAPDVFGFKYGNVRYLGLVIGSGWQEHPLDTVVEDRVYMLRIAAVTSAPTVTTGDTEEIVYEKLTEADLYDTTENLIGQGTDAQQSEAAASLKDAQGWYIRFTRPGEKMLSTSQTIANQTFFTTYEPTPSTTGCVPSAGAPRLFHISAEDGTPVLNYDLFASSSSDNLTREDREVALMTTGLPPSPQRMRIDGKDIICVGAECIPVETVTGVVETYWYEE